MKRRLEVSLVLAFGLALMTFMPGCGGSSAVEEPDATTTTVASAEAEPGHDESHPGHGEAAGGEHGDAHDPADSAAVVAANGHGNESHGDSHAASDAGQDAHGLAAGGDAHEGGHGAHHDPYESATHGNASPQTHPLNGQGNLAEWKTDLAIWSLVIFGLMSAILFKFAWGPICAALDERESSVQANIDAAREQNEKASALLADHEAKLSGTADEVRRMLDDAKKDAESQKANIIADAQTAAESEKQRAVQEIEAAKNGALRELAEQSVDTAVGMAGSIVKRELKPGDHSSLISEALKHFPGLN